MDNFYMSKITPLFFVECLADLEKKIRSSGAPEQLVGSLADRTPDAQGSSKRAPHGDSKGGTEPPVRPEDRLPSRRHAGGGRVQLGDKKGVVFRRSPERKALERWTEQRFS